MDNSKKHCLITGCSGFIGSHLCDLLLAQGWRVDGVDNLSTGNLKNLDEASTNPLFTFFECDFNHPVVLETIAAGLYDYVFHLAATASVPKTVAEPFLSNENNVTTTLALLETIRTMEGKKPKFVFSSSSAVYGNITTLPTEEKNNKNPISPYALQKSIIEDYCEIYSSLYDIETVSLRYFNVYGTRQNGKGAYANVISSWLTKWFKTPQELCLMFGDGSQSRDFVHVQDVCKANFLAATTEHIKRGEKFNICSYDSIPIISIKEIIQTYVLGFDVVERPKRKGDVEVTYGSYDLAYKTFGWYPEVDYISGMYDTIQWYKNNS